MVSFVSLFHEKMEDINEINKEIYDEINFFFEMEELAKSKLKFANEFVFTWNKGDFSRLRKEILKSKHLAKKGIKIIRKFKERIKDQDEHLLNVVSRISENETQARSLLKRLNTILDLDENILNAQIEFFKEEKGKLWLNKEQTSKLLRLIYQEASMFTDEKNLLAELKQQIERLESMKHKGLLTPTKLRDTLMDYLSSDALLNRLYVIERAKVELESLVINNDLSNPKVNELKNIILDESELNFFFRLKKIHPKLKILCKIIERAKNRSEGSVKESYEVLYTLLKTFSEYMHLTLCYAYINLQMSSLRMNDFHRFMIGYQQEKAFLINLFDILHNKGVNIGAVESVLLTLEEHRDFGDLPTPLKVVVTSVNMVSKLFLFIARSVQTPGTSTKETQPDIKIKPYVDEIYSKYGIQVTGECSRKDLSILSEALTMYNINEIKGLLNHIVYTKETKIGGKISDGAFNKFTKILSLRAGLPLTGVVHELAHIRIIGLPAIFMRQWYSCVPEDLRYDKMRGKIILSRSYIYLEMNLAWKYSLIGPSYGYAAPYGSNDWEDDVATFMHLFCEINRGKDPFYPTPYTMKELKPSKMEILSGIKKHTLPYYDTYINKTTLLLRYGFINSRLFDEFKRLLDKYKMKCDKIK